MHIVSSFTKQSSPYFITSGEASGMGLGGPFHDDDFVSKAPRGQGKTTLRHNDVLRLIGEGYIFTPTPNTPNNLYTIAYHFYAFDGRISVAEKLQKTPVFGADSICSSSTWLSLKVGGKNCKKKAIESNLNITDLLWCCLVWERVRNLYLCEHARLLSTTRDEQGNQLCVGFKNLELVIDSYKV